MSKPKITTKGGDRGEASLFSGERVSKTNARLEAYGDLDELVSTLGVARQFVKDESISKAIIEIQRDLFIVSSELATTKNQLSKIKNRVDQNFLDRLEKNTENLYNKTELPNGFILPGSDRASAFLDLARAISRRCERKIVALAEAQEIANVFLLAWINRLSDYLYLMARFVEEKPLLVKE